MADSFTHMSGNAIKLKQLGTTSQYALAVSVEDGANLVVDNIDTVSAIASVITVNTISNVNAGTVTTIEKKISAQPTVSLITVSTASVVIATANLTRTSIRLQNVGVKPSLVLYGNTASETSYNLVLSADTATRSGTGGTIEIKNYTGKISAITEADTTIIAVTEI